MIAEIFHQIVWASISFLMFFTLMNKFVFKKIEKIQKKRQNYIVKLNDQIENLNQKTISLKEVSDKILNEEIPARQLSYVKRALSPTRDDLEMEFFDKKQELSEKLAAKKKQSLENALTENVKAKLRVLSGKFVEKM